VYERELARSRVQTDTSVLRRYVGRVCLALLREWEGAFMRHADGIDGTDMGECSTIDFTHYVFSFVITEVYGETRACGKHRDRCGDRDQDVVLVFYLYTCLYR